MTSYLLSYDISNDKLRNKLSKILLRYGCKRLQKSVFLAPNFSKQELDTLRTVLEAALSPANKQKDDSLLCLPIVQTRLSELLWHGELDKIEGILSKAWNLLI